MLTAEPKLTLCRQLSV